MMIKTLIVEDERLFREALKRKIERFKDFQVVAVARNGKEARIAFDKNRPDVIFTDVKMPGQDGLEFIESILYNRRKKVVVIYVSGYPNFEYVRRAMKLKAFDYLTKPIDEEELRMTIHRIREELNVSGFVTDLARGTEAEDKIDLAKNWVDLHLSDATLSSVANYVQMNPSSFSRKFKQQTGNTFIHYLTKTRIERACELLKNPIYQINEISNTVGYSDYQHFYRLFKKELGVSPERYRENLQKNL
ncbi:response regulator transcription factor [Gracilibacillus alcaliphilus]|nr:two-component system response regulator YesN [Gracilibacillus alcaliphilus]